ncbi:MAG: ferredoxin [Candidatus Micrarchaeota archaeon]
MAVKIEQDQDACIGCGACVSVCPDNWEMDESNKAKPLKTELDEVGCNQEAASACPVQCIQVIEG